MLKVGVVGLGGIAQKAYLPVTMSMSDEVEWHMYTRNQEKLRNLGEKYRIKHLYQSIEALIESGIEAVFIHTATHTHTELIEQFLKSNIHVYVDKPISEDFAEVEALVEFARKKNLLLVTGFNRRFAPMIQKVKKVPDKNMIFVQKTRQNSSGDVRFAVFDMFIHVIDTALYLLDEPVIEVSHHLSEEEGKLKNCLVQLKTENTICIASMNYKAGSNYESVEVQSPSGMYRVENLTDFECDELGSQSVEQFGDWEPVLEKRGFAPLIRLFLQALRTGENPVPLDTSLQSHQICHQIVNGAEKSV